MYVVSAKHAAEHGVRRVLKRTLTLIARAATSRSHQHSAWSARHVVEVRVHEAESRPDGTRVRALQPSRSKAAPATICRVPIVGAPI
jgi:hypothetical protein